MNKLFTNLQILVLLLKYTCDLNSKIKIINKNNFIHSEIFSDNNFYSFEIIFELMQKRKEKKCRHVSVFFERLN